MQGTFFCETVGTDDRLSLFEALHSLYICLLIACSLKRSFYFHPHCLRVSFYRFLEAVHAGVCISFFPLYEEQSD